MSELYSGILLWVSADGSHGAVADTGGQSWLFRESIPQLGSFERVSVYQNGWRPQTSITKNPRTGKEIVSTVPEIVEFQIEFFTFGDGRAGHEITSMGPASDCSPSDREILILARDKYERERSAARKERYVAREVEAGVEGMQGIKRLRSRWDEE